ncbi:MAG: hypothetical protein LBK47_09680 [Prevotellaceae bacterium]|jgi:hypothetical protein|nr:hypothetical protein [Prevotellaceae bacterium]
MKLIKNIVPLLVILLSHKVATTQEILIKASLDRDSILVGDQVDMTLNIAYSKSLNFLFPAVGDTLMPGVEVVKQGKLDTIRNKKKEDLITVERKFTLTSFEAGVIYSLPKFQLLLNRNSSIDTISSSQLTLKVMPPPMDSTWTPNGVKPPIEYPITFGEAIPYVSGALLVLAIIAFVLYYLDRRAKNKPLFSSPKPKEPAHVIAFRALDKLKEDKLWQQSKTKEYYTRISEILRVYTEDRYGVPAMEQTSDEILKAMTELNLCSKEQLGKLSEVFAVSDLVKFAKFTPTPMENESSYSSSRLFVEQTMKMETTSIAPTEDTTPQEQA